MNDDASRKRLGRGLAALIGEMDAPPASDQVAHQPDSQLPIDRILPNPSNPRAIFADADIEDLSRSIAEHGIVQPVVVRPSRDGTYEIIAGERRWRAAHRAGLDKIPVIIREVDDRTALEIAIVENVQRADLNALEEARGYERLIEEHGYTQLDLSKVIGKSRSHVANTLRLLKLPEAVRSMLTDGALSAGHARALVTAADPEALARRIADGGLSVRQAEALAQNQHASEREPQSRERGEKDADTRALEKQLTDMLGMRTSLHQRARGGELRISYQSLEQLDELCRRLRRD